MGRAVAQEACKEEEGKGEYVVLSGLSGKRKILGVEGSLGGIKLMLLLFDSLFVIYKRAYSNTKSHPSLNPTQGLSSKWYLQENTSHRPEKLIWQIPIHQHPHLNMYACVCVCVCACVCIMW